MRTIRKILQHLKVRLADAFNGVGVRVRTGINVQNCDSFRRQSSAFGSNSQSVLISRAES